MTITRGRPAPRARRASRVVTLLLAVAGAAALVAIVSSRTSDSASPSGSPSIIDAYATPALVDGTTAIYFTVNSPGPSDAITAVTTDVGGSAAFYKSAESDDMSTMDPVDRLELPGRGAVTLSPGGVHVMAGPTRSELKAGDFLAVTVEFEQSPGQTISVMVRSFGDIAALGATGSDR